VRSHGRLESALGLLASLVLENGLKWGDAAERWQWIDAAAILEDSDKPYSYLTRPRGGSKTSDLAAIAIAAMLCQAPRGARLYGLAADRDQGALLIDSIRGWLDRTPALHRALDVSAYEVTVPEKNVTLTILAADAASAWGLKPYLIIVDELAQWRETAGARRLFEAVRTSVSKANARMVILTTAGDPTHFAFEVLEHARNDPLWRVHEVPGPIPWVSHVRLEEQRRALPEST